MTDIINTPLFGILISLIAFNIGCYIHAKTKIAFFNPLLLSLIIIIGSLRIFNIDYNSYKLGGDYISFFLTPATVILAVPLYKKINLIKKDAFPILISVILGSSLGMISIIILSKLFRLDKKLLLSLIPKSVTVPIGMEISKQVGGLYTITIAAIVLTGIIGAIISPFICKIFKITDKVAIGTAIGTSAHAVGTTKAIEMGETEGALSGLCIGVAGLITVFLAPLIVFLYKLF